MTVGSQAVVTVGNCAAFVAATGSDTASWRSLWSLVRTGFGEFESGDGIGKDEYEGMFGGEHCEVGGDTMGGLTLIFLLMLWCGWLMGPALSALMGRS